MFRFHLCDPSDVIDDAFCDPSEVLDALTKVPFCDPSDVFNALTKVPFCDPSDVFDPLTKVPFFFRVSAGKVALAALTLWRTIIRVRI